MSDTSFKRGQRAVYSVLDREFAAHRSLWLGALLFGLFASLAYPFVIGSPDWAGDFLKAFASFVLFLSLFFLWTLNLLFKSFGAYVKNLDETERADFLKGLYRGLALPLTTTLALTAASLFMLFGL